MVDIHMGINDAVGSYLHTFADIGLWIDLTTVADDGMVAHIGISADIAALADLSFRRDKCQRVYTCLLRLHRVVELKQFCHTLVGILHSDERGTDRVLQFHVLIQQDDARLCVVKIVGIFGVGQERDGSRLSFFYFGERMYGGKLVAFYSSL